MILLIVLLAGGLWWAFSPGDGDFGQQPPQGAQGSGAAVTPAAAASDPEPEADPFERLEGTVVDLQGRPVAGAQVILSIAPLAGFAVLDAELFDRRIELDSTSTDELGAWSFEVRAAREYEVTIHAQGQSPVVVEQAYGGSSLRTRLGPCAAAEFVLSRAQDATPLPGATIDLWMRDGRLLASGRTDAQGRFEVAELPVGWAIASIAHPAAVGIAQRQVELRADQMARVEERLAAGVDVFGRITDAETGEPIVGAQIADDWRFRAPVVSDDSGEYRLGGLAGRPQALVYVRAAGYGSARGTLLPSDLEGDSQFDFALSPARRAFGRVVDDEGLPLEGATVVAVAAVADVDGVRTDWEHTTTDLRGVYAFERLDPDLAHQLLVRHEDFGTRVVDFPESEHDEPTVDLSVVDLAPGSVVRGQVLDGQGRPRQGVEALLAGYDQGRGLLRRDVDEAQASYLTYERRTRTDTEGRFHFGDLAAGTYRVLIHETASNRGFEQSVIVPRARVVEHLEFELRRGRSITGTTLGPRGEVLGQVVVEAWWDAPLAESAAPPAAPRRLWARTVSDDQGRFEVSGLDAKVVELTTSADLLPAASAPRPAPSRPLEVVVGATGVDLALREAAPLVGSVRLHDGAPATGMLLRVAQGERTLAEWWIRADGRFAFEIAADDRVDLVLLEPSELLPGEYVERLRRESVGPGLHELVVELQ